MARTQTHVADAKIVAARTLVVADFEGAGLDCPRADALQNGSIIPCLEETEEKYIVGTSLESKFYLSGSLRYECIYKNKNKHGMEWWFNEDRNPRKINLYLNGDKIINHELSYEINE